MSLADEYRRQLAWRAWPLALDALPPLAGCTVLDLGCAVGDLAAELAARGARVLGLDSNEELLAAARSKGVAGAEFRAADLRALPDLGLAADGIWCGFAAAYFPDLAPVLAAWGRCLRPGGWIALTEIADLFGHRPLSARAQELLAAYAREALAAGRYDFHMGGKLRENLERSGFALVRELTLPDQEFSFDGPARPEVLVAWGERLDRMQLLRASAGPEFEGLRAELLACLARADHRSVARVCCCIATKK